MVINLTETVLGQGCKVFGGNVLPVVHYDVPNMARLIVLASCVFGRLLVVRLSALRDPFIKRRPLGGGFGLPHWGVVIGWVESHGSVRRLLLTELAVSLWQELGARLLRARLR